MDVRKPILPSAPLLPLLASFVAGMICAWQMPGAVVYGAALLAALCVFGALMRWRRCAAMGLFAVVGAVAMYLSMPVALPEDAVGRNDRYRGWVEDVKAYASSQRIVAQVDTDGGRVKVVIDYFSDVPPVANGDSICFESAMVPVCDGNPIVPGEYSMHDFALRNGISARCVVEAGHLSLIGGGDVSVSQRFASMRSRLSDYIFYDSGLEQGAASMLDALVTGNDESVSEDIRNRFSASGTAHVLALSGMHVGIISCIIALMLVPLRMINGKRSKCEGVLLMVALWAYVVFTGSAPSVVRAAIMASCVLLGGILRRGSNPLNSLCAAALAILIVDPLALFAPGFQLSFAAVASIVMFSREVPMRGRWLSGASALVRWLVACVAAVVGTGMLAAWHFHQIPFYFLLANAGVAIVVPWFMGTGMLLLILQLTPIPVGWLVELVQLLYGWMDWVTGCVAAMPGAVAQDVFFSAWLMVPYYLAVWAFWWALHSRRYVYFWCSALLILFTVCCGALSRPNEVGDEAYAIGSPFATDILLSHEKHAVLLTDAPLKFHAEMSDRYNRRLAGWMGMRGVDSICVTSLHPSGSLYVPGAFYIDSSRWVIGRYDIVLANVPLDSLCKRAALPSDAAVRYVLVSRGFRGDVVALAHCLRADTMVISHALHGSKVALYSERLQAQGVPFIIGFGRRDLLH